MISLNRLSGRRWRGACALLLVLCVLFVGAAQAQAFERIFISAVDTSQFPRVRVRFRAIDAENSVVQDLTLDQIALREDDTPVEPSGLERVEDGPLRIVYLIDLGRYANFQTLGLPIVRSAFTQLVNGEHFIDDADTAEIRARVSEGETERTLTLRAPTQSGSEFTASVRSLEFEGTSGPTSIIGGVEEILEELEGEGADQPTFVVVLTHVVDRPSGTEAVQRAREVAQRARALSVRVYTFHTRFDGTQAEPLQVLSGTTGGRYVLLERNVDKSAAIEEVYADIEAQRLAYELVYRSPSAVQEARTVTIRPAEDQNQVAGASTYQVALEPPMVEVVEPTSGRTFEVRQSENEQGEPVLEPDSIQVRGQVTGWPDGFAREVRSASLLVNGRVMASQDLAPGQETFSFQWELPSIEEGAVSADLQVRVEDELGLRGASDPSTVSLDLIQEETGLLATCRANFFQATCIALAVVPVALIGFGVVALLGVGLALFRREGDGAAGQEGPGSVREAVATLVPGAEGIADGVGAVEGPGGVLAQLEVISGPPDQIGTRVPIHEYVTVLGRDPDRVDITFYPNEQSSVSGKHATLQLYFGKFYVTDNGSTNGTRVNGQLLVADEPRELSEGDEIVLGEASLKGVRLRLHLTEQMDERAGLDATQIEADLDEAEAEVDDKTEVWDDEMEDEEDDASEDWMDELE